MALDSPLFESIAAIIASRLDADFDEETVEDLMEAVGEDTLYGDFVVTAVDEIQRRIGLWDDPDNRDRLIDWKTTNDEPPPPEPGSPQDTTVLRGGRAGGKTARLSAADRKRLLEESAGVSPPGTVAVVEGTCPNCKCQFSTTVRAIIDGEADDCPHCHQRIIPEPNRTSEGNKP